jgi:hypothetical protein
LAIYEDFTKREIRNEEIKQQIEGSIMDDIKKKQLVWYRRVQRINRNKLPKQIMKWITGKRKRGRPRTTWEVESDK